MLLKLRKIGNSYGIIIPAGFLRLFGVKVGQTFRVSADGARIVIEIVSDEAAKVLE